MLKGDEETSPPDGSTQILALGAPLIARGAEKEESRNSPGGKEGEKSNLKSLPKPQHVR